MSTALKNEGLEQHKPRSESQGNTRSHRVEVAQLSRPRDPMGCSLSGFAVRGVLQARILERVPSVRRAILHTCLFTCTKLSDVGCAKHVDQGGNSTPRGARGTN